MYVGITARPARGGLAVRVGSSVPLCRLPACVRHLFIVYYEEPTLRRLFGTSYESYCKSVSRWISGLP